MAESEDPAQMRANEVGKAVKGPLQDTLHKVEWLLEEFPSGKDFHFYYNFPHFKNPVRSIQTQVDALLNDIGTAKSLRPQTANFPSDPDESYDWLVSLLDDLVEGIDSAVDQLNNQKLDRKRGRSDEAFRTPRKFQWIANSDASPSDSMRVGRGAGSSERRPVPFHVKSIPRPQDKFDRAVDNSNTPFRHLMDSTSKLEVNKEGLSALDLHARKLGATFEDMHPLEEELKKMEFVNQSMLEAPIPQEPRPLMETPLTVVTTLWGLSDMAASCRLAGEIAVDLENHQYRSFQGFVCLMQVSTRTEDFIVDTLSLRSHIGPCLKDIFADAKLKKVMHGADRDIVWLQRDFGIYVCNMFDTGQAARVLQLEGRGLAFLLQHYLAIYPDKRYQLADWRIRPLPADMIKYAREDTHYLLYMYDLMRVQLLSLRSTAEYDGDDPLLEVYERSRDICLQMYKKDVFTETSYLNLYGLHDKQFSAEQMSVLAGLYAWRDHLARKEDESTGFVLPNQLLFKLAEEMPDTLRKLQILIRGPHSIVGQHAAEVLEVIRQAKEHPVPASTTKLEVPEHFEDSETKGISVSQSADGAGSDRDSFNQTTTEAGVFGAGTSSASASKSTEVHKFAALQGSEVVDVRSTLVEQHGQGGTPSLESAGFTENAIKSEKPETRSIKEITVGPAMSAQVTLKRSAVEDTSPASTINIRKLNTAVLKRASVPSLALFGGSSKKSTARHLDLDSQTESVEPSSNPSSLDRMGNPARTVLNKRPSVAVEPVTFEIANATVSTAAYAGKAGNSGSELSSSRSAFGRDGSMSTDIPTKLDAGGELPTLDATRDIKGAAGASRQEIEVYEPPTVPERTDANATCITSEVCLVTSLNGAGGSVQIEQESKRFSATEVALSTSRDCSPLESTKPCVEKRSSGIISVPLGGDCNEVLTVVSNDISSEQEKLQDAEHKTVPVTEVSASGVVTVTQNTAHQRVCTGSTSGRTRQGLGALLGSSARSKTKRGPIVDKELEEAKLRASRIHASLVLPFHQVSAMGEQQTETGPALERSTLMPAASETEILKLLQSPSDKDITTSSPDGAPFEELRDHVIIERGNSGEGSRYSTPLSEMREHSKQQRVQQPADLHTHKAIYSPMSKEIIHESGVEQKHNIVPNKSQSEVQGHDELAGEFLFQPYDYDSARREIGLEGNLVSRIEDNETLRGRGRGRGNPNKRQKQLTPPTSTNGSVEAFDPLRRVRQEPRPEGILAAKRRQVFPQTGNRTATFRR